MSDYKEIWETLSQVDVSEYVEEKMNLSYLSWSRAWYLLCQKYADAKYLYHEPKKFEDGTMEVAVTITIGECSRSATLPVMDYKNNAVQNPNSRQVNDTKMRCLVKCFAMYGLGHYIYAGEDVPSADKEPVKKEKPVKEEPTPVETPTEDVEADNGYGTEEWAELFVKSFLELSKLSKTKEAMTSYYKNNTKDLATLRDNFPKMKADLDSELKTIVSNLKED